MNSSRVPGLPYATQTRLQISRSTSGGVGPGKSTSRRTGGSAGGLAMSGTLWVNTDRKGYSQGAGGGSLATVAASALLTTRFWQ